MKNSRRALIVVLVFLLFVVAYWTVYAIDPDIHNRYLRNEDRAIEWITFTGFILASIVTLSILRVKAARARWPALYLVGLGLFFFVCAGEEISWGQRVFGFKTPTAVKLSNEQHEFNLHNLKLKYVHPEAIVSAFMKIFGIVLPLACWWRRRDPNAAWRRYIPGPAVVPAFAFSFLLGLTVHSMKATFKAWWGEDVETIVRLDTNELVEMYWGLAVMLAAWSLREAWRETNP